MNRYKLMTVTSLGVILCVGFFATIKINNRFEAIEDRIGALEKTINSKTVKSDSFFNDAIERAMRIDERQSPATQYRSLQESQKSELRDWIRDHPLQAK